MRIDSILLVVALWLNPFNAIAKDINGDFAVKGVGVLTCQQFIEAASQDAPILQQYAGYISGYISAYNEYQLETFDLLPWQQLDTVMLLLLQSCNQTPNSKLGEAVSRIAYYFSPNSLDKNTQKVEIKGPTQSVYFYPVVIKQIKDALKTKGYNTENLWQAMKKYQLDKKLIGKTPFEQLIIMKLLYGKK